MEPIDLIDKINKANKIEDLLDTTNLDKEFRRILMVIHPDRCKSTGITEVAASEAASKLTLLKDKFINGSKYTDDSGEFKTNGYFLLFTGQRDLLNKSLSNYDYLRSLRDEASLNFQKYLPKSMTMKADGLEVLFDKRAIPLTNLKLPQEHVNWVLSRLLEFVAWLRQEEKTHCGINPESVFIIPETHGIQVVSFYHMCDVGSRLSTISGKYQSWYPPEMFDEKRASSDIDIELAKKTAIYLMGDPSGNGIKLKKSPYNQDFVELVISRSENPADTYFKYREMLKKNFDTKKFYPLNL